MPSLVIPKSGLSLESSPGNSSKSGPAVPDILGLTLTDGMIEEMIKCVQNGKPIQLSLGEHPNLSLGNKTQHLSTFEDSFTHELYCSSSSQDLESSNTMSFYDKTNTGPQKANLNKGRIQVENKPHPRFLGLFANKKFNVTKKSPTTTTKPAATSTSSSATAGADAALAALQNSMASADARKKENTTKFIDQNLPIPGQRRGAAQKPTNKNKFLAQKNRLNDTTRSMPVSPNLSGTGSPSLGPTSVPLSQQQAELSKTARKPVVHLLALGPMSEKALQQKIPGVSTDDLEKALSKVADENPTTGKFELKRAYYKELDVWSYKYETDDDRQLAIQNAIKVYDKLRMSQGEAEWERLKPKAQRGDGVSLSKVQAKIAQGPIPRTPKIHVQKADSGRNTPTGEEDLFGDKALSRVKGEGLSRSASQPPTMKPKKVSEKEAQSKRILSKPAKKAAPKPAPKKEKPKAGAKVLSSQFVSDSDEEDDYMLQNSASQAPVTKRARDEDISTSSDSSVPLSKKVKKDATTHRTSDASQSSRTTNASTYSSSSTKTKGNSPQKSSPLASSPPTNASEFDNTSSSSSSTPAHPSTKTSRSPIHKRHQKSSSVVSSSSSTSVYNLKPHIIELAARYRVYYPKYAALYRELSEDLENRDEAKEDQLLDMHERLMNMKQEIKAAMAEDIST